MVICCKFEKNLFNLYTSFHDLINVYSRRSGNKTLMSTEISCHFGHLLQVSKKSLRSLILYNIFHDFIHIYSPWAGADNQPLGDEIWMSTGTSCHFGHLLQVSNKSLWILILDNFFHNFIHVNSPRQGQTAPREQSFDVKKNVLSLHSFVASFKQMSFKSDFIPFFSWLIHVYSTRARVRQPPGDKVLMSTERPYHFTPFIASFKEISLKSGFIHLFSWFNTCI